MTRLLIAVPVTAILATINVGLAVAPAMAAEQGCTETANNIRVAAAEASDPRDVRRALSKVSIGEKLCDAGNERAANKKFADAMKTLGMSETEVAQR